MGRLRAACLPLVGGMLCSLFTPVVSADTGGATSTDPGPPTTGAPQVTHAPGSSTDAVGGSPSAASARGTQTPGSSTAKAKRGGTKASSKRTSRAGTKKRPRGRRPKPKARAPGSQPGAPNEDVRRSLTGRYPDQSTAAPVESPELKAMRELDNELFPPVPAPPQAPWSTSLRLPETGPEVNASGLPPSAAPTDPALAPPPDDLAWIAKLKKPDFPVRFEPSVVRYLKYYKDTTRGRQRVARWIQKSGRYRQAITELLRQYQMPEDILWLALVESAFEPTIHSHAGAAGLWQFMPATGRIYGLTVNRRVDERLDPERSTHAALRHLKDLNQRFGSWELAFAAYNMGYGGLLSSIRKYNTNDYWELRRLEAGLPYETALYVPKIVAMAVVARNCDVFGCKGVKLDEPRPFGETKTDKVSVAPGVTLADVAKAVGVDERLVSELNPHVIGSRLPPVQLAAQPLRSWTVYVPEGKGKKASQKLPRTGVARRLATHRTRWGEPLDRIAASYGTSATKLMKLNDLHPHESPRPGTDLFVPATSKIRPTNAQAQVADTLPLVIVPDHDFRYDDRRRVFYEPVFGDTLADVARVCGVTAAELRRWNHLDANAALQEGMWLQLFLPQAARPAGVVLYEQGHVRTETVSSEPFFDHFIERRGRRRIEVTVQEGDTWTGLSKRYGLSLGMLERINHRSRRSTLTPGQKVVVYARQGLVEPPKPPPVVPKPAPASPAPKDPAVAPEQPPVAQPPAKPPTGEGAGADTPGGTAPPRPANP